MAELKIDVSSASSAGSFPTPPPSSVPEASRWTAAERREFGTDRTPEGEKIKRPMNAFMVWAQMRRAEITANSTKVHNSLISKALGIEWKTMSDDQKLPYVQKAKELRDELFKEHPNYVYRPRKRKRTCNELEKPKSNASLSSVEHSPVEKASPISLSGKSDVDMMTSGPLSPALLLYPGILGQLGQLPAPSLAIPHLLPALSSNPLFLNQLIYAQMIAASLPQL